MATDFNPALSSRFIDLSCRSYGRPSWSLVHQILHNLMVVTQESTWRSYLKFSSEAIIPDLLRSRSNVRQKLMLHLNIGGPTENIGETVGYDVSYRNTWLQRTWNGLSQTQIFCQYTSCIEFEDLLPKTKKSMPNISLIILDQSHIEKTMFVKYWIK